MDTFAYCASHTHTHCGATSLTSLSSDTEQEDEEREVCSVSNWNTKIRGKSVNRREYSSKIMGRRCEMDIREREEEKENMTRWS